jgi:hypothetical protein
MKINLGVYIFWEPKLKPILILGGTLVPVFDTQLTLGLLLELKTGWNQCWTNIGLLTYPFDMSIWLFLNFVYHGSMGIEAKIWKFTPSGINMYKVYNFHTMVCVSWYWNVWY